MFTRRRSPTGGCSHTESDNANLLEENEFLIYAPAKSDSTEDLGGRLHRTPTPQQQRDEEHDATVDEAVANFKKDYKSFRKVARSAVFKLSNSINMALDDISATTTSGYPASRNNTARIVDFPFNDEFAGRRPVSNTPPPLPATYPHAGPFSWMNRLVRQVSSSAKNLGVPSCVVCGIMAPTHYQYHPFFPKERACVEHGQVSKCCSCHRFEPSVHFIKDSSEEFADLQDQDRKLCPACMRTVVLDTADSIPVWNGVIDFMDSQLNMFQDVPSDTKSTMLAIPILMVGHDGLNDPSVRGSGHGGGNTRGLCMYEYRYHPMGGHLKDFLKGYARSNSGNRVLSQVTSVLDVVARGMTRSQVTAILCLKGLPRDLAGSILAHEATHAWFKLHPAFNPRGGQTIPIQVEEGCCQLMAFLYLNRMDELDCSNSGDYDEETKQPTDKKLRQYFRFCIESDTSEVYGEGFRLAADAYAKLGSVQLLLEHVVTHFSFPKL